MLAQVQADRYLAVLGTLDGHAELQARPLECISGIEAGRLEKEALAELAGMVFLLATGNRYHFLIKGSAPVCDLDQLLVRVHVSKVDMQGAHGEGGLETSSAIWPYSDRRCCTDFGNARIF
jgi:hypothetical protein